MAGRPKRAEDLQRLAGEPGLAELVWSRIEEGVGYGRICMETGLGKAALLEWADSEPNAERHALARARAARSLVDEALEIADSSGDVKMRVGQRNWIAERFNRQQFGQKVEVEHKGSVTHQHLVALQETARARAQAITHQPQAEVLDVEAKTLEQQLLEL